MSGARELTPPMAVFDVGGNTIHLIVARAGAHDDLEYLADELDLTRLSADISATGAIGPERTQRAIEVIGAYLALARSLGAQTTLGLATEGVRAASNSAAFLEQVRQATGTSLVVITGDEEAALTYWGATSSLPPSGEHRAALDLGGGSLELVIGAGRRIAWRVSLPLGSGVIHDRFAPSDPPAASELAALRDHINATLAPLDPPLPVAEAVVTGGTGTTLAALAVRAAADLAPDERAASAQGRVASLTQNQIAALLRLLQTLPAAEIAARYDVEEARAKLLVAGGTILLLAMERLQAETLHISKAGVREGALLATLHAPGGDWRALADAGQGW